MGIDARFTGSPFFFTRCCVIFLLLIHIVEFNLCSHCSFTHHAIKSSYSCLLQRTHSIVSHCLESLQVFSFVS